MIKKLFYKKEVLIKQLLQKITAPFYYGNNYYCNCCNKKFRKFLKKGNNSRPNARCPYCSSLERTRVLDFYIDRELNIYNSENIKILHFAPELGLFRKLRKVNNITYIDADINPAYARNVIDITDIPFSDDYFDYILCSHVLGHVRNEKNAISELHRVLKKDGIALVFTVLSSNENTFEDDSINTIESKLKYYGEPDLCRLHGKDFEKRLGAVSFYVEKIDYRLNLPDEIQKKHSLGNGKREIIFKCTKL